MKSACLVICLIVVFVEAMFPDTALRLAALLGLIGVLLGLLFALFFIVYIVVFPFWGGDEWIAKRLSRIV